MEKKTVVLYPGLAVGHFVPMMHLAGALVEHGYAVLVVLIDPGAEVDIAFGAVVSLAVASMPSVRFHTLPAMEDPPSLTHDSEYLHRYLDLVRRYNERLHGFLRSSSTRIHAVVVDSVLNEAIRIVKSLGIPGYSFFTSSATSLAAFAQLPTVLDCGTSFKELGDAPLQFFGLPPLPASHLFGEMLEDPQSNTYRATMALLCRIPEPDGTLVNTFESLEPWAVAALGDPRCVPDPGYVLPPVYCVGPFVGGIHGGAEAAGEPRHECLAWLDGQPDRSVVFLCFGSEGRENHSEEQLSEIAAGLEESGHRFLWVVRALASDNDDPRADPDLDALLPDGFLERTVGRGLVVKLWAPQVEVLRHRATGVFVTHCGWNSVLEGVTAGVPMLRWPLYSEQKMDKVLMVGNMGVGFEMVGWQQGLVKAGEVEAKVRLVMESEEGRELSSRVVAHKKDASVASYDGGSSRLAFAQFLADMDIRQQNGTTSDA